MEATVVMNGTPMPHLVDFASDSGSGMGSYAFRLAWGLIVGLIGMTLALDVRNSAMRLTDHFSSRAPGGETKIFSSVPVRIIGGILGVCALGAAVLAAVKMDSSA
ncbi:hypothetical protein AB0B50_21370 [Streptomyces sp. NPDC041068]|uniref:hypothetical protein n=1 Tax=Streptomyces sp. NPDC041068 TaxID=3155130 RepID=UPI0033F4AD5F